MLRSSLLLLMLLQLVPTGVVEAQRATMNVSAVVLPPREALTEGRVELRPETGHTMTAKAEFGKLFARRLAAATPVSSTPKNAEQGGVAISLDLVVSTNVHYQAEIKSDSGTVRQPVMQSGMHAGTSNKSRRLKVVLPEQSKDGKTALTVVLIASSIT